MSAEATTGATWLDMVREYFPDATKDEADCLLWERTAFPLADARQVRVQLRALQLMPACVDRVYAGWGMGESVADMAERIGRTQRSVREHRRIIKQCLKQAEDEVTK